MTRNGKKTGPKPKRMKLEGDWQSAINSALRKEKPNEGWPKKGKDSRKSNLK
jgi:hypothetical protein